MNSGAARRSSSAAERRRKFNSATTFDNLGRATSIISTLGAFGYSYDGITGRVTQVTAPNGVTTSLRYAGANGLRRAHEKKGAGMGQA